MPLYVNCPNCECRIKLVDLDGKNIEPLLLEEAKQKLPEKPMAIQ